MYRGPSAGESDLGTGGGLEGGGGGVGVCDGTLEEATDGANLPLSTTLSEPVELACDSALGPKANLATFGGGGGTIS